MERQRQLSINGAFLLKNDSTEQPLYDNKNNIERNAKTINKLKE